ncbi:hypothetical protein RHGRI_025941 [Rhododendron griersonianum]|uniref:Uncharacterized protein n=1 Tax=Rhododendron griersonianum TaxID=479676 RepID=A0AAV6IQW0_9ERIC|nr:hypothetical protein RHGRI_025941 [Rhododendron griersonianum]
MTSEGTTTTKRHHHPEAMQQQQHPPQLPTSTTTPTTTTTTTLSFLLLLSLLSLLSLSPSSPSPPPTLHPHLFPTHRLLLPAPSSLSSPPSPPSIAYLISGSANDSVRILRLLLAIFHPKNQYLLHLDRSAAQTDRDFLALIVHSMPIFKASQNVNVIGKPDFAYQKGSSPLSSVLHGASILLRVDPNWDWFINLSAADYPLVSQDDLLHILSYLPRDLNFVNHTSYIGWRESRKLKPIIVDPGLYLEEKNAMFYATQKRELPDAFQLFMGSPSAVLSRKVLEFSIVGTENLPRTLLMYLANTPSSASVYFPTLLCNSHEFNKRIINHGLRYASFDEKKEPRHLKSEDFDLLIGSGAAFGSPFLPDDPVLDRIDQEILSRSSGKPVPGGWCIGELNNSCDVWGDANVLRPGLGARRLENFFVELLSNGTFWSHQCIVE